LTDDTWDRRETALGTEAYGAPEAVHIGHPVFFGLTGRAAGPKRQYRRPTHFDISGCDVRPIV
jgi:hypothetical protein